MFYEERLKVGYRYFAGAQTPVLYPFGYGLSYTTFQYADLKVKEQNDGFDVSVHVKNCGQMDGQEVVQLYVSKKEPIANRPIRELKAFTKVALKHGETVQVNIRLGKDALACYSSESHSWYAPEGAFMLQICSDAHTVLLEAQVESREENRESVWD